jgi:outer membrane protein assembly factor BamD
MKRITCGLILSLLGVLLITGCAKNKDPYAAYRKQSAAEIFERGQKSFDKKHYADAVKSYDALNTIYPFSRYSQEARLNSITAYYKDGDNDGAMAAADEYIRLYPQDRQVDYAYYMKGLTSFRGGLNWLQKSFHVSDAERDPQHLQIAYNIFRIVVQDYPRSQYREQAQKYMKQIRDMLADHEIRIGQFYFKKKAYMAAINRANAVLTDFTDTPSVADALVLRAKAYQKLNMPNLANDSLERLKKQYPNSRQLRSIT